MALIPDRKPDNPDSGRSVFARLALPRSFSPDLGAGEALLAVVGTLMRIFGACLWFALWGGMSAWVWSGVPSRFWRALLVLPLVLAFAGVLTMLMLSISALQRRIATRR